MDKVMRAYPRNSGVRMASCQARYAGSPTRRAISTGDQDLSVLRGHPVPPGQKSITAKATPWPRKSSFAGRTWVGGAMTSSVPAVTAAKTAAHACSAAARPAPGGLADDRPGLAPVGRIGQLEPTGGERVLPEQEQLLGTQPEQLSRFRRILSGEVLRIGDQAAILPEYPERLGEHPERPGDGLKDAGGARGRCRRRVLGTARSDPVTTENAPVALRPMNVPAFQAESSGLIPMSRGSLCWGSRPAPHREIRRHESSCNSGKSQEDICKEAPGGFVTGRSFHVFVQMPP
jgi:hypothetical protein